MSYDAEHTDALLKDAITGFGNVQNRTKSGENVTNNLSFSNNQRQTSCRSQ